MKKSIIILSWFLISGFAFLTPTQAQVERVEIRVDGLACPFCAYGLEKKLKDVEGVGEVKIQVKGGLAVLQNKQNASILVGKTASAVKDAGFTPRGLKATAVGRLGETNTTPVLFVRDAEVQFILAQNKALQKLRSQIKSLEKFVRVTGQLTKETPEGHQAHPYTLTIEEFEVLQ